MGQRTVTESRTIRLLSNDTAVDVLQTVAHHERSASEVARLRGLTLGAAHHLLGRLVAADLVRITRETPRAGRPIKHYQAKTTELRIPAEHLPLGLAHRRRRTFDRLRETVLSVHAPELLYDGDVTIALLENGVTKYDRAIADHEPRWPEVLVSTQRSLTLTPEDADRLRRELWSLADVYTSLSAQQPEQAAPDTHFLSIDLLPLPR